MARATIDILFKAVDQASGTANKIGNAVDGINKKSELSIGKAASLGAAFGGAMMAIEAAANIASNAIGFIGTRISEASQANNDMISTTGMLQGLLDTSFGNAGTIVDKLGDSIFKATNALPGITKEYDELANSIIDNLIPAAKSAEGVLDPDKLIAVTTDLTKTFGLIGRNAGLQRADTTLGLSRAIGGGSMAELRNLGLFERNPALMNQIKEQLTQRGVTELKELDEKTRIEILRKVGGTLVSPETLSKLTDTLDARIEGLMGTLFDPKRGMFGFLRKLDDRGGKNVLDAVKDAFDGIMKIFEPLGKIAKNMGFSDAAGLELIFDFFSSVSDLGNMVAGAIDVNAITNFLTGVQILFDRIQEAASKVIDGDLAAAIDIGLYAQMLGENWANGIMDWIESIDWASVLIGLGRLIIVVGTFVTNLVAAFAAAINARVAEIYQSGVQTIIYGFKGIFDTISNAIVEAFNSVVSSVTSLLADMASKTQNQLNQAVGLTAPTPANDMAGYRGYNTNLNMGGDNFYITIQTSSSTANVNEFANELIAILDTKWNQYKGSRFNLSGVGA